MKNRMKIYLTYTAEQSVEYCFWKYFFRLTGIWIEDRYLLPGDKIDTFKVPQLVLLDKNSEDKILNREYRNIFYCIENTSELNRRDMIKNNWESGEFQKQVIKALFKDIREYKDIFVWYELLDIFNGEKQSDILKIKPSGGLWAASWFFHEMNILGKSNWDKEISNLCMTAIKELDKKNERVKYSWNYHYMRLYCGYLQCAVNFEKEIERNKKSKLLLNKCNWLAKKRGWEPTLYFLAGKISLLSSVERKNAIYFFENALNYEKSVELYYTIGYVYQHIYQNQERALINYQMAYQYDANAYHAIYQFGLFLEKKRRWIDAISVYDKIRTIVKKFIGVTNIEVMSLEYEYKVCRRVLNICENYINDEEIKKNYQKDLKRIVNIIKNINLEELMGIMFDNENAEKKLNEIYSELKIEFER